MTQLCRDALRDLLARTRTPHAGLLLARGLTFWPADGEGGGRAKKALIDRLTTLRPDGLYLAALARWQRLTTDAQRFTAFQATLAGRLYIGVTRDNALEAGVTTSHAYGMPLIPGSAVKGVCRAAARRLNLGAEAVRWMFGAETAEAAEAGGLVFHDAWWVGGRNDRPFVCEVVTPHHAEYYGSQGETPATDFDSPIPAYQIAVTGAFHFAIEGDPAWTRVAARLLQMTLVETGIGGKRSSGYGLFTRADGDDGAETAPRRHTTKGSRR